MVRTWAPDELWQVAEPLIPSGSPRPQVVDGGDRPMAEHLLDRDQIHAAFVVVSGAGLRRACGDNQSDSGRPSASISRRSRLRIVPRCSLPPDSSQTSTGVSGNRPRTSSRTSAGSDPGRRAWELAVILGLTARRRIAGSPCGVRMGVDPLHRLGERAQILWVRGVVNSISVRALKRLPYWP
jgi:hypothetical protein